MSRLLYRLMLVGSAVSPLLGQEILTIDTSKTGATVQPQLYGHNFEFTRHDNFEGLMAEMIANRKFAVVTPCGTDTSSYKCWPQPVQQMMSDGFLPRWKRIGQPVLDEPYWTNQSSLLTGQMGHSIHCSKTQGECGVEQGSYFEGFNSGMSFGSGLVFEKGGEYRLRLVLRGEGAVVNVSLQSSTRTYARAFASAGDAAVCDESARLKASCKNCGPNWGDLTQCQLLCDSDDSCQYVTYFSNQGCRMYSACNSTWNQQYGVDSYIYKKASVPAALVANTIFVPSSSWSTLEANITAAVTSNDTILRISGVGDWWLGSASLTRVSNTWRGMRRDVVDAMKSTGFHGLLRYPGGCFAPHYRWQVGLLDPDMQPPISTPPDYCAAVKGGVNAYTDGTMQNGVGIDDFLALCEEIDMEPAITVRLMIGDEDEISEAAAWVEYCNGDAETTQWGRLRAERGHPKPYNVTHWYLGNEISQQVRYPSYPANMTKLAAVNKSEYVSMLRRLVPAMLLASPTLPLRLFAVAGTGGQAEAWNAAWAEAVGDSIYATSTHDGYLNTIPHTAEEVTAAVKRPQKEFLPILKQLHTSLGATGKNIVISADEWGLGYPWLAKTFGVAHGMYAAAFLSLITRVGPSNNLQLSNYFEAINEGAITVGPTESTMTSVGQVMPLYAQHERGTLVLASQQGGGDDLDVLVTQHPDQHIVATIANLNAVGWTTSNLTVQLIGWECDGAEVTELRAQGFTEDSVFEKFEHNITVSSDKLFVSIRPLSIVHLKLSGRSSALYV